MVRTTFPLTSKLEDRGPALSTLDATKQILRDAEGPLSLGGIKRRLSAKAARYPTVRKAVDEFKRLGFVIEGSKGLVWVLNFSPRIWSGKWEELWAA